MQSSASELKLLLGESLLSDVRRRADALKVTPEEWVFLFLAKGRLTPEIEEEAAEIFFELEALNA